LLVMGGYANFNGSSCGIFNLFDYSLTGIPVPVPSTTCNKFASSQDVLFIGGSGAPTFGVLFLNNITYRPGVPSLGVDVYSFASIPNSRDVYVGKLRRSFLSFVFQVE
jgi:hypothetical protein